MTSVIVNDCGTLNPNLPLMVSYDTTIVNSTANYSCETGYEIVGNPTSSCQENGMWRGPEPTCIGECLIITSALL